MSVTDSIEIHYSPYSLAIAALCSLALAAFCGAIALQIVPDVRPGSLAQFAGWTGLIFFGAGGLFLASRFFTQKGPVVTLTETGITDTRVAADEIPWKAIREMRAWEMRRQKMLVLEVDPAIEATLRLTRMARWSRDANRRLGADGLCVATNGLRMDQATLTRLCAERIIRARGD